MSDAIEIPVVDTLGQAVGKKSFAKELVAGKVSKGILHKVVRWQRAKKRSGTHSAKSRAEVSGGGAKPWKQKGTGRARAGSNTSTLWVGGGVAHGPRPRKYDFSINKKEKVSAISGAISAKNKEGRLILLDQFKLPGIKTKAALDILQKIGVQKDQSAVVVVSNENQEVFKSLRNVPGMKVIQPAGVNVYDIIGSNYVVFVGDALENIQSKVTGQQVAE